MTVFETKIALILGDDLAGWQALNVTAFLTSGIVAQTPDIIGEPYIDFAGNRFNPLTIQPMIVLAADRETLRVIHRRALERGIVTSAYIEEMFSTGHDAANRAAFAEFSPDTAKIVGIGLRSDKRIVDRVTKGARMHP